MSQKAIKNRDITNQYFGQWTAIRKTRPEYWFCRCSCGVEKEIRIYDLFSNKTTRCHSCGCTKHNRLTGKKHDNTCQTYYDMKQRCLNKDNVQYHLYGGRGIQICNRWLGSSGIMNFLKDMGEKPKGKTLDRINNHGDYCPENCRWATPWEQSRNRRPNPIGKSGYRGVIKSRTPGKWIARTKKQGKQIWIGSFNSKEEAALAYNKAVLELFGETAETNIIK